MDFLAYLVDELLKKW